MTKLSESEEKINPIGSRKYSSASSDYGGNSREKHPPIEEPSHGEANFGSKNKNLLEILKPDAQCGDGIEDNAKEANEYYTPLLPGKLNSARQHKQSAPALINIMPHKYQLTRGKGRP